MNNITTVAPDAPATSPDLKEFLSSQLSNICDTFIALILTLCTLVGLPGNIVSLLYFNSVKHKNFSNLIYTIVCNIDVCTCVVQIPVMIALFNARRPGVFGETIFCKGWSVAFYYLQQMSMFLVMLLSVSRSIKLIFLQHKIKRKYLIFSFLLYSGLFAIRFIIVLIFEKDDNTFMYRFTDIYCLYDVEAEPLSYIDQLIHSIGVGCPPIITTISFTAFLFLLFRNGQISKTNKKKHQAAVTMGIFTILHLACNLPCFLNNILWFITELEYSDDWPEPFYGSKFMLYYSWLISDVVSMVLNATLNPVLYFYRMKSLRDWVNAIIHGNRATESTDLSLRTPQDVIANSAAS